MHAFSFLTQLPVDDLIEETVVKRQNSEARRAKSVLTNRVKDDLTRKINLAMKRKKLDRVLYEKQQIVKQKGQTDFLTKTNERRNTLHHTHSQRPRIQEMETNRETRRIQQDQQLV